MALSKQNSTSNSLSAAERERYARHLTIPEVGEVGQGRLKSSRVLLIGAGGLGAPIALYLAASGVGQLTIVDHDHVSLSNLQRQILFTTDDVGLGKAQLAKTRIEKLNPEIDIIAVTEKFTLANARELVSGADLVIDGTDNFATRYLVNDVCVLEGKPFVFGAIFRFDAQVSVFGLPNQPCYRCLYPEAPGAEASPNCADAGVLGVLPGTAGLLMATEAVKYLLKIGEPLAGQLIQYDALSMSFFKLRVAKREDCEACGKNRQKDLERHQLQAPPSISTEAFARESSSSWILDVRNQDEFDERSWPGAHLVPLAQLSERTGEIPRDQDVIVICQTGKRSARAVEILRAQGWTRARSLDGGLAKI